MDKFLAKDYYLRDDVQKAILGFAKDREIGVMFNGYFGKRPDILEYLSDVKALVAKGVFSFHASEERWANPLLLGDDKLSEEDRNKNRIGWDLILDLDGVSFEYSRYLAKVILDYFDEIGLKNSSIKFSGNKGFHIGVPFEAFSKQCPGLVVGIDETRLLFPDVAKKTVLFLLHELKSKISKIILDEEGGGMKAIDTISKKYNIPIDELEYDEGKDVFNFMKVIEIDTILITTRHLFRMPYSLNEKSGLVSVPIKKEKVLEFDKRWAKPENVKPEWNKNFEFLKYDSRFGQDGNVLLDKVYSDLDYMYDEIYKEVIGRSKKNSDTVIEINEEVSMNDFPETIKFALSHDFEDGRKRALFLIMTFLSSIKWDLETIENMVYEWNKKQTEPLKLNYVNAQLSWFKAQSKILSPPNYNNSNYYTGIGITKEIIAKDKSKFKKVNVKNPLHYVYLLLKIKEKGKKK